MRGPVGICRRFSGLKPAVLFKPKGPPDCAADGMAGMSPPVGSIPLRLRPGPSIGLEPLIKVCWLQTELTTLMKLSPAGLAMTCDDVVPVVMDVPMVGRGMVITGKGWLRANCCWANWVRRAGCDWFCTNEESEGVGVTDRGALRASMGCGVEQGVFVGVGVDGLGVPDLCVEPIGEREAGDSRPT